ncbi:MAG: bifunctional UDP-N-acetylmuramoyl-tripeptide:D-alanyl-D-alanine ligase/alanine racemase [Bacteroidota bacterium]|nr:bifunctional UDP-N-acetylmuramoyl-tripeptide:D-alanyl-D-alanine ligase/alanine racemase [Bacteroidota bacterium]
MLKFFDLPNFVEGEFVQCRENGSITDLLTDSRKIIINSGAVFFASKGERHDGHHFIKELYQKGIRQFIVEDDIQGIIHEIPLANIFFVINSLSALQEIAAAHRNIFHIPVVAITGSNGKTIVKEWLAQLLSNKYKVVKSPKSFNSQLGVPLSIWQVQREHEIGVFEAGISKYGEMEKLESVIQPNIGIFTNIGTAHDQNFLNTSDKIFEKIKLFRNCKHIIYCKDHKAIDRALKENIINQKSLISWSQASDSPILLKQISKNKDGGASLEILFSGSSYFLNIPFSDDASVENCMHCITCLLMLDFSMADVQKGLNTLSGVSMRLELKEGVNDCYIVDDSYNNDLAGLEIALDFLLHQKQKDKRTLILSDILQSGLNDNILYQKIASLAWQKGINRFIGIGKALMQNKGCFDSVSIFYKTTADFINDYKKTDFKNELILVKGARPFCFEKIVRELEYKHHGTVLEIDLNALTHNLNFYKSRLKPQTKIMVMVKAFAYGSGSFEVANLLQYHRVDFLAVAYTDEGITLRENGIHLPIMVMNPSPNSFDKIIDYNLEPEIYSLKLLRNFINFLNVQGKKSRIHLKLDSGMHRLGFEEPELMEALPILKNSDNIEIVSVFSHLAGADEDLHLDFSRTQTDLFIKLSSIIEQELSIKPIKHILNSAGIIRFPEFQFDMVRLGIGLYGIEVNNQYQHELLPVSTLKTTISQVKHIKAGHTIGYSRKGLAEKKTKIATIAIGYADGFSRSFSNGNGTVLVKNQHAPVIGNVCMDMTMIDVTGIDVEEGDEVIIFGKDLPIYMQAKKLNNFPYELLTNVSERVKRIFFAE